MNWDKRKRERKQKVNKRTRNKQCNITKRRKYKEENERENKYVIKSTWEKKEEILSVEKFLFPFLSPFILTFLK